MEKPELIIFTGNIGCGKSTLATKLAKQGYVIINGDSITTMVQGGDYNAYDPKKKPVYHATERAGIVAALKNGFSVVIDRTNMKASDRARYIEMGKNLSARICSYCWGPGDPWALERRIDAPKGIPEKQWREVFDCMAGKYEKPNMKEGFDSILFFDIYGVVIDENTNPECNCLETHVLEQPRQRWRCPVHGDIEVGPGSTMRSGTGGAP